MASTSAFSASGSGRASLFRSQMKSTPPRCESVSNSQITPAAKTEIKRALDQDIAIFGLSQHGGGAILRAVFYHDGERPWAIQLADRFQALACILSTTPVHQNHGGLGHYFLLTSSLVAAYRRE